MIFRNLFSIIVYFDLICIYRSTAQTYNVLDYGARGDGVTSNTDSIGRTIATAAANGGGIVTFPSGTYLSGPIRVKSNITLDITAKAVLKFSDNFDDYLPMVLIRDNLYNFSPLIHANGADNIAIVGGGTLDGSGQKWWDWYNELRDINRKTSVWPVSSKWQREYLALNPNESAADTYKIRPYLVLIMEGKNITIRDVTLKNAPFYHLKPLYCDGVTISGLTVESPANAPNTDGIDPDASRNVRITNTTISVGDDCIAIKAGSGAEGLRANRSAENILIANCTMRRGHGGVSIGSSTAGGVRNVTVADCLFDGTDRGVRLKSARGNGGVVEHIRVDNVVLNNIVEYGITLNLFYSDSTEQPFSERTPVFRNIHIGNISGTAGQGIELIGLRESPLENIYFENVFIKSKNDGIVGVDVRNVNYNNVSVVAIGQYD